VASTEQTLALQDYNASQALDPTEAVALFRSGTPLAFLSAPYDPFVMGRWMGEPVLAVNVPPDLENYFTINPVIVYGTYVPPAPGVAVRAIITIRTAGWTVRGNNMEVDLPLGKVVDLTVAYEDANGDHASPPGPITWSSSDESIATVEAEDDPSDGTVAVVTSVAEGSATITAQSGEITATLDITVQAAEGGDAVSATITAGEPRDPADQPVNLPAQQAGRAGQRPAPPTSKPAQRPFAPIQPGVAQRPGATGKPPIAPGARRA
jgi:hypothetical protein